MDNGKAKRWIDRRQARKAQMQASMWGHDHGLEGAANPLMFHNRHEYDRIAAFLRAASGQIPNPQPRPSYVGGEFGQYTPQPHYSPYIPDPNLAPQGMMGPEGPRGRVRPYDTSSEWESGTSEWAPVGRALKSVWNALPTGGF